MTTKALRIAVKLAEVEGLRIIDTINNSKHLSIIVANKDGWRMTQPIGHSPTMSDVDRKNLRANFRRFAKGLYHNAKLVGKDEDRK